MTDDQKKTFVMKGIGVSPGIVIGRAYLFNRQDAQIPFYRLSGPGQVSAETRRFRKALRESEKQLLDLKNRLGRLDGGIEPSYIIDVHIMIMRDRRFINRTVNNIREMSVNAEWALHMTVEQYREIFNRMEDDYLRERISDIQYAGQRILTNLVGGKRAAVDMGEGVVIIATDLSPADTAQLKIDNIVGFATDMGGKTSHTAIVARSMAIPAVLGLESITQAVRTHDDIIVDGSAGIIIVHPDPMIRKRYTEKISLYEKAKGELLDHARLPAVTKDHYRVEIGGNIEFIEEIPSAILHGADGIGLYRTEFIYINREKPPDEEEHLAHYRSVVGVQGLSWATIRTFDLGGDKFFPDRKLSHELNPQLGLRAIRFCLKELEIFKVQLRAILRASVLGKLRIMFPMISGIEEIREAKRILMDVKQELLAGGTPLGKEIEIGIMIEVPSAVIVAEELAKSGFFQHRDEQPQSSTPTSGGSMSG